MATARSTAGARVHDRDVSSVRHVVHVLDYIVHILAALKLPDRCRAMRVARAWYLAGCDCRDVWAVCDLGVLADRLDTDDRPSAALEIRFGAVPSTEFSLHTAAAARLRDADLLRMLARADGGLERLAVQDARLLTPAALAPLRENTRLAHLDIRGCFSGVRVPAGGHAPAGMWDAFDYTVARRAEHALHEQLVALPPTRDGIVLALGLEAPGSRRTIDLLFDESTRCDECGVPVCAPGEGPNSSALAVQCDCGVFACRTCSDLTGCGRSATVCSSTNCSRWVKCQMEGCAVSMCRTCVPQGAWPNDLSELGFDQCASCFKFMCEDIIHATYFCCVPVCHECWSPPAAAEGQLLTSVSASRSSFVESSPSLGPSSHWRLDNHCCDICGDESCRMCYDDVYHQSCVVRAACSLCGIAMCDGCDDYHSDCRGCPATALEDLGPCSSCGDHIARGDGMRCERCHDTACGRCGDRPRPCVTGCCSHAVCAPCTGSEFAGGQ